MEQEKIGKFIAALRKEKNLTQMQLAEKLNITDRAVSKWERGKSMPDSSIMLELCKILDINVNELLMGERIEEKDLQNSSEINLVKALTVVEKGKRLRKRLCIILASIILIGIIGFVGYLIYWNGDFPLDYNSTLIECSIEDNMLIYKDYREPAGGFGKAIIEDEENNITYVFLQTKDFFTNYIGLYDDVYERIGYIAISDSRVNFPSFKLDLEKDLKLGDNKLKVYYTEINLPFYKELEKEKLPKLLKEATLLLEYN